MNSSSSSIEASQPKDTTPWDNLDVVGTFIAKLFCRGVCEEFRQPIHIAYPELEKVYAETIAEPVDLGTMLKRCLEGKSPSAVEAKRKVKLMLKNAIDFNAAMSMIVNMSLHIETYACGLYEELLRLPWQDNTASNLGVSFQQHLIQRRRQRYVLLEREGLYKTELEKLNAIITRLCMNIDNSRFVERLKQCGEIVTEALQGSEEGEGAGVLRLRDAFAPVFGLLLTLGQEGAIAPESKGGDSTFGNFTHGQSIDRNLPAFLTFCALSIKDYSTYTGPAFTDHVHSRRALPFVIENTSEPLEFSPDESANVKMSVTFPFVPNSEIQSILGGIDDSLGELLVDIEERSERGDNSSNYWSKPIEAVWSTVGYNSSKNSDSYANKPSNLFRLKWWPCLVLGGGHGTTVPSSVTQLNLNRLNTEIVRYLHLFIASIRCCACHYTP